MNTTYEYLIELAIANTNLCLTELMELDRTELEEIVGF